MQPTLHLAFAAIHGALAVAAGAFGAHALTHRLEPRMLTVFETAARYHMYHALGVALMALAALATRTNLATPLWLFHVGILLFCGSLYVLALTGVKWLGAITPLGGSAWIIAWLWAAWRLWQSAR